MSGIIIILFYVLGLIFSAFILYLIIRLAVKHGMIDAAKANDYRTSTRQF